MKKKCPDCNKRYVTSKKLQKEKREVAPHPGDDLLCDFCLKDAIQIAYEQSYFGSMWEWGA